jgi:hypothetical protein
MLSFLLPLLLWLGAGKLIDAVLFVEMYQAP